MLALSDMTARGTVTAITADQHINKDVDWKAELPGCAWIDLFDKQNKNPAVFWAW